jgi:hypothetical protein
LYRSLCAVKVLLASLRSTLTVLARRSEVGIDFARRIVPDAAEAGFRQSA